MRLIDSIIDQAMPWVCLAFVIAVLGLIVSMPLAIATARKQAEEPLDFGDWEGAKYRKEAVLRDEIAQRLRTTKLGDKRRRTAPTTGVIQTIPEQIAELPVHEEVAGQNDRIDGHNNAKVPS